MQLVIVVGQVEGNLQIGTFPAGQSYYSIPLLLRFGLVDVFSGSELVRNQVCLSWIFPGQQQNVIVTPFINAT